MAGKRTARRDADAADMMLGETLDLRQAAPLAAALLACRGADATANASAVRRLGAQCLQVLLSAQASWQADGKSLRIIKASDEFTKALGQFGAADLLQLTT